MGRVVCLPASGGSLGSMVGAKTSILGRCLAVLCSLVFVVATFEARGVAGSAVSVAPRKQDVRVIECQVCERLAEHVYTGHPSATGAGKGSPREDEVIEFVEKSTTAWRPEGAWITHLHISENVNKKPWLSRVFGSSASRSSSPSLEVRDMGRPGECTLACRTIEFAAQKVMGEHDADVGEALYVGRYGSLGSFREWFCGELTGACRARASGTVDADEPRDRPDVYGPFVAREEGAQDIERMLGEMADQGLRGKMYTREEAMEKYMMDMDDGEL